MGKRSLIAYGVFLLLPVGASAQNTERDPNVIRADEMTELLDRSVYEAVQQLRPRWLMARRLHLPPSLLIDNQPHRFEVLQTMRLDEVESLRFLNARDTIYPDGAIQIERRR